MNKITAQERLNYLEQGLDKKTIIEEFRQDRLLYYDTLNDVYLDEIGYEIIIDEDEEYNERLAEGFAAIFDE